MPPRGEKGRSHADPTHCSSWPPLHWEIGQKRERGKLASLKCLVPESSGIGGVWVGSGGSPWPNTAITRKVNLQVRKVSAPQEGAGDCRIVTVQTLCRFPMDLAAPQSCPGLTSESLSSILRGGYQFDPHFPDGETEGLGKVQYKSRITEQVRSRLGI